jgi:hypothetical protein
VDQGRKQDVTEPVGADTVEILVREVESEPTLEGPNPPLDFIATQDRNAGRHSFILSL